MNISYKPTEQFLKEEIRNGYTVKEEMKKVWAVELDLLQVLLDACNRYCLRILAEGGSLFIGAIRQ